MFGVARSWDTATLTGSRVTHGRVHETVAESGGCRPDHVAPSLRTVTLFTDWPERASWALVASRQVPLPLSLSQCVCLSVSLSSANCEAFKKAPGTLFGSQRFPSSGFGGVPDGSYSSGGRAGLGAWRANNSQPRLLSLLNPPPFEPAQWKRCPQQGQRGTRRGMCRRA